MTPETLLGQQLGSYQLEAILGRGGMAVVYRAHSLKGEIVAVKVLFPPPGAAAEIRTRFEREARTAARLRHPGIVPVLESGQAEGYAYLAMRLVEGQSLADRLVESGDQPLGEALAVDVAWQIADALYYAHGQGVVHRDVKPSNILLTPDGRALLTDFGVAQALDDPVLTRTGQTVGTPAYMAPEQASGEQQVDGRADLYSLGVVLYQMVTGRPPFQGPTPRVLHAHLFEPPPPPSSLVQVTPAMEAVIMQALAKDVSQRFQTGAAMAQALASVSEQTGTQINFSVPPKPASVHRARLAWLALIPVLLALAYGIWQFSSSGSATPAISSAASPIPTLTDTPRPAFTILPSSTSSPTPSQTPTQPPSPTPTAPPTFTSTPSPTFSPIPPVLTVTDTPTLLPTTPPCPNPVSPALTALLEDSMVGEQLGCPEGEALSVSAAWQPFENGLMLWRNDLKLIHVLGPDQTWSSKDDLWREGDLPTDPNIKAPDGLYQPQRGFGIVWREETGVRDTLDWGTAQEAGFEALIQRFAGGMVWLNPNENDFFILFNDGSYRVE